MVSSAESNDEAMHGGLGRPLIRKRLLPQTKLQAARFYPDGPQMCSLDPLFG